MKITYSQIGAFIRIMLSVIHSDNGNAAEASHVAKFINRFKLSVEQKKNLQMIEPDSETDADYENLKKLDDTTKQELSNLLFDVMAADGTISDQESMLFMTLMSDSEFPIPDTQAWLDWLASSEEAVEETDAMSDEERIALWLKTDRPEDNGFDLKLSHQDLLNDLDYGPSFLDDEPFDTIKDLLMYVIDHDEEQLYYELLTLAKGYRMSCELEKAAYWAHKAIVLGEKGLEKDNVWNFGLCGLSDANEELGNCYFSVPYSHDTESTFPDFKKAAHYYYLAPRPQKSIMRGRAYLGMGDYQNAEKCFSEGQDDDQVLAWMGHLCNLRHQVAQAERYWKKAIQGRSGWGEYFYGRYLWNRKHYDTAISLWQQGEKKGCSECTGELFNWIIGHPQTPFSRKEEMWNKVHGLHYRDECISGYKYIYKHVDNGNIPIQEDVDENGKETKINSSIMMSNALYYGIKKFCPYCLKHAREEYTKYSDSEFKRILLAWGYNEFESSFSI